MARDTIKQDMTTKTEDQPKSAVKLFPRTAKNKLVSVVIPCINEEKNIDRTLDGLLEEAKKSHYNFEIIAVNDGSTDDTWSVMERYASKHKNVIAVNQMANFGQSQAYQAGFDLAKGDYVVLCSADMETPLHYVHTVIEYLDAGYDFVNSNRLNRWGGERAVKSGYANKIIAKLSGVTVKDTGSGLKGMITPIAKNMKLYGEMHRFLPVFASVYGAKIVEFDTEFKDREYGVSYYKGHKRTIKVILDLVTMTFMLYFAKKPFLTMPGRLFGFTGAAMALLGAFVAFVLILERLFLGEQLSDRPLFTMSILTVLLGVVMTMLGMLGELLMRVYFESSDRRPYMAREILNHSEKSA